MSSTSGSCAIFAEPHFAHFAGLSRATVTPLHAAQCHAGMRCPHHNCREMHQSRMLRIQLKYSSRLFSGIMRISPLSTAAIAGSASGFILQNHCVEARGSTIVLHRSQCAMACVCSVIFSSSPCAFRSSATRLRAANRSIPAYAPAAALMCPLSVITSISGRLCRRPASKSLGSCAGVIFTAPVPNSRSTISSAISGISRCISGSRIFLPARCL